MTVFEWIAIVMVCLVIATFTVSAYNRSDNIIALLLLLIGLLTVVLLTGQFANS